MAVYDELVTYFNRTIKPYSPYKGNSTYQAITALLRDEFLKDSYQIIPTDLSTFVNDQKININLYDKLLIGNGYPDDVIKQFNSNDKQTLLEKLMHYQNESGNLHHFNDICSAFSDDLNLYELYADYRIVMKDNKPRMDWVLVGYPIYKVNNEECEVFDYQEVYNKTPTLFLSRNQLENWRISKAIVLPFKTNMICISQQNVTEYSTLDIIIGMTAYSQFQYDKISFEYESILYNITLGTLYQMWQYFVAYADANFKSDHVMFKAIMFPLEGSPPYTLFPNSINSVQNLIQEYHNISDKESSDEYLKKIVNAYGSYLSGTITVDDLRSKLSSMVSLDLIKRFEDMISNTPDKTAGLYKVLGILDGLLSEYVENAADPLVQEYASYLKLILQRPKGAVVNSTTYKLLYEFKPYHTRFILDSKFKVKYDDKLENTFIKDKVYFVQHVWHASSPVLSDSFKVFKNYVGKYHLVNGEPFISQSCADFHGVDIGNLITFVMLSNPDVEYCTVQVTDIQKENVELTETHFNKLRVLFPDKPDYKQLLDYLKPQIINQKDNEAVMTIKDVNEAHEIAFYTLEKEIENTQIKHIYESPTDYDDFVTVQLDKIIKDCIPYVSNEFDSLRNSEFKVYNLTTIHKIYDYIQQLLNDLKTVQDKVEDATKLEEVQSDGTIFIKHLDYAKITDLYNIIINSDLDPIYKKLLSIPFTYDESIFEVVDGHLCIMLYNYTDVSKAFGFDIYNFYKCIEHLKIIFDELFVIFSNYTDSYIDTEYFDNFVDDRLLLIDDSLQTKVIDIFNTLKGTPILLSQYNVDGLSSFTLTETQIELEKHRVYVHNELILKYRLLKQNILLEYEDLVKIEKELAKDDICRLIFDKAWDGPTGWYDQLKISDLPPVQEIISPDGAQYTFTNIELAQYVHTNDIGFYSVFINDYIYVVQDDMKHAVKVIGKDANTRNLKIDKTYTGTAGTFSSIGRYRTGF